MTSHGFFKYFGEQNFYRKTKFLMLCKKLHSELSHHCVCVERIYSWKQLEDNPHSQSNTSRESKSVSQRHLSYAASIISLRKVFVGSKERRRSCSQSTRGAMFARALETRFAKSHRCYMRPKPALRHFRGRLRLYAALGTGRSNGTRRRAQFLARLSQRTEMQLLLFRQCAFYRTAATSIRA